MACFYVFVENTVPMAIGRTGAFPNAFGTL